MPTNSSILQNEKLWKSVIGELELSVPSAYFNMFFPKTKISTIDDENKNIQVSCPNDTCKTNIQNQYSNLIRDIVANRVGQEYTIEYTVESTNSTGTQPAPLFTNEDHPNVVNNSQRITSNFNPNSQKQGEIIGLIPEYNFEKYIVGPNNRLAYTVAKSVAESPGKSYNPFLVYSDVGLGKTHLLHAIGNEIAKNNSNLKIIYCTGQDFLNELMDELQTYRSKGGTISKFKNKFTSADVWLIDDVQHIAGRNQTQEEFYFAFNSLILNKKQIVLSTDKHPSEISKLESRISSRFAMGMIADMQMPDVEVRSAILRKKRIELSSEINDETIDFLAENINTNIRELEGAFIQVITYAKAMQTEPSIDLVKEALSKTIIAKDERNVKPNKVIQAVAKYYNIEIREIKGKKRTKDIVLPRHVTMYLLKEINRLPLIDIGQQIGGRDHTTILHATEKINKEIENGNFKLKREISDIKEVILTSR